MDFLVGWPSLRALVSNRCLTRATSQVELVDGLLVVQNLESKDPVQTVVPKPTSRSIFGIFVAHIVGPQYTDWLSGRLAPDHGVGIVRRIRIMAICPTIPHLITLVLVGSVAIAHHNRPCAVGGVTVDS